MTEFSLDITRIRSMRKNLLEEEKKLFRDAAKAFMKKWGTDTIYFDYQNSDAPCYDYTNYGDDVKDCQLISIKFTEEGNIAQNGIAAHLYYECEDIEDDAETFYCLDYLELAEFIDSQLEERYNPDEDEE